MHPRGSDAMHRPRGLLPPPPRASGCSDAPRSPPSEPSGKPKASEVELGAAPLASRGRAAAHTTSVDIPPTSARMTVAPPPPPSPHVDTAPSYASSPSSCPESTSSGTPNRQRTSNDSGSAPAAPAARSAAVPNTRTATGTR
eukprot:352908-Chlamydomonas_euryale.AAC.3